MTSDTVPGGLTYGVVTAARNEVENLARLAAALAVQTVAPTEWIVVENGSTDGTLELAEELARTHSWIRVLSIPGAATATRGAPIVRALQAGIRAISPEIDIVVNVDADISFEPDYFNLILNAFVSDPQLGIASGSAYEEDPDGTWTQRFVTGGTVWGATRAYRRRCLDDVLPFEERHGWDGIDQLKARSRGWSTRTLLELPFRHHRPEGARDGSNWAHWLACGDTSHFMRYRPWYLLLRVAHQTRHDRAAIGMLAGYAAAVARRRRQLSDPKAVARLRDDQRFRNIALRRREALGFSEPDGRPAGD